MALKIQIWLLIWYVKNLYGFSKISVKLIYAQSFHETGGFTSAIFKENSNLFGMRKATIRKHFNTGENRGHATYKNYYDSIRDYFERQKNYRIDNTSDSLYMVATVNSGYATDTSYLKTWQKIYDTIKIPVNNNILYIGVFFFLVVGYSIIKKSNK